MGKCWERGTAHTLGLEQGGRSHLPWRGAPQSAVIGLHAPAPRLSPAQEEGGLAASLSWEPSPRPGLWEPQGPSVREQGSRWVEVLGLS